MEIPSYKDYIHINSSDIIIYGGDGSLNGDSSLWK